MIQKKLDEKMMFQNKLTLAGDAYATVDPTTGLGCNTAIQSSTDFLDFIWDFDKKVPKKQLLSNYHKRTFGNIGIIHKQSFSFRNLYKPCTNEELISYIDYEHRLQKSLL